MNVKNITGKFVFHARFHGVAFESIEIVSPKTNEVYSLFHGIKKILISSSHKDGILLEIEIDQSATDIWERVFEKSKQVADLIAISLLFHFKHYIEFSFLEEKSEFFHEIIDSDGTIKTIPLSIMAATVSVGCDIYYYLNSNRSPERPDQPSELEELKDSLERILDESFKEENEQLANQTYVSKEKLRYYKLAYFAAGLSDPIAQHMILYLIVSIFHNDNQNDIDGAILKIDPNVPKKARYVPPRIRHKKTCHNDETIYSTLRNQCAHNRGVDPEITRQAMEGCRSGFIDVVKKIIDNG